MIHPIWMPFVFCFRLQSSSSPLTASFRFMACHTDNWMAVKLHESGVLMPMSQPLLLHVPMLRNRSLHFSIQPLGFLKGPMHSGIVYELSFFPHPAALRPVSGFIIPTGINKSSIFTTRYLKSPDFVFREINQMLRKFLLFSLRIRNITAHKNFSLE
jgi:hypothetical protein